MSPGNPLAVLVVLALGAGLAAPTGAQELPLRGGSGDENGSACPSHASVETPLPDARVQAGELLSEADQSVILGDLERAAALLERAIELDPESADLAYRRARVLEDWGRRGEAIQEYCRARELAGSGGLADVSSRLEALLAAEERAVPEQARSASGRGLAAAQDGDLRTALRELDGAVEVAPAWPDLAYNRGVTLARLGMHQEAMAELQRYLELAPDALDAAAVSRRIGQIEAMAVARSETPSPVAAATLGTLFPGMGQLYSGRAKAGLMVASLAGGTVAAGLLMTRVDVRCQEDVPPGESCPAESVVSRSHERPHLRHAVGLAAAITVFGAVEAFLQARRRRSAPDAFGSAGVRVEGPSLTPRGGRLDLNVVQLRFR